MRILIGVALVLVLGTTAYASQLGQRASSVANDAWITVEVRGHLVDIDPDSAAHLQVNVSHGFVTLSGAARTRLERSRYVASVRGISGVTGVRDEIVVDPTLRGISEEARDAAITVRVTAAIASQAGGNVFHVSPETRNGVVVLRGSVPSRSVERTIVATTRGVPGVRRVIDELVIQP